MMNNNIILIDIFVSLLLTVIHSTYFLTYRIDKELLRLQHKKEIEKEITAKIQELNKEILPTNYEYNEDFENSSDSIVHHKDEKMAHDDPQRYCADRCVATGHCDVFEDLYDLSPVQVIEFCTDCVLSEEEEVSTENIVLCFV